MPHENLLSPTLLSAPRATPPRSNIGRAPADYAGPNRLPLAGFVPSRQSAPECFPCQVHAFVPASFELDLMLAPRNDAFHAGTEKGHSRS